MIFLTCRIFCGIYHTIQSVFNHSLTDSQQEFTYKVKPDMQVFRLHTVANAAKIKKLSQTLKGGEKKNVEQRQVILCVKQNSSKGNHTFENNR